MAKIHSMNSVLSEVGPIKGLQKAFSGVFDPKPSQPVIEESPEKDEESEKILEVSEKNVVEQKIEEVEVKEIPSQPQQAPVESQEMETRTLPSGPPKTKPTE